ncbi:MAG: thiamine pyrophosphate-dependent dehydrogenase E1 component subunit alpha [Promethearchaeota archaeon]
MIETDTASLYELMFRIRKFEEAVKKLWEDGKISGEMHTGVGEEAVIAGVISQLQEGDALALDHRGTAAMLARGVDPVKLLLEFLGHPEGLCGGEGGHMHLFSKEHLAASSGIVGAAGPAAVGFAIAIQYRGQPNVAVAFFGEGAMNQGMLMEALNMAGAWKLPVLFVCKDNDWAITTRSGEVTGGNLLDRARALGVEGETVDGMDVEAVWRVAFRALVQIRAGEGPFFLHAKCTHRDGHFLGDPLLRFHEKTWKTFGQMVGPLVRAFLARKGTSAFKRAASMKKVLGLIRKSGKQRKFNDDPVKRPSEGSTEREERLAEVEERIRKEVDAWVERALETCTGGQPQ